ncbi:hypothetical protein V7147_19845 [Bacillus sp. JJ1521]|uniref:hypothetical protein n=1 Tax=Bacillus sp. JJ1521 TaxID=3122957 RepID=UPI002FFF841B
MNDELNSILNDSFGAISILLVFVTVLFGIRYPEIKTVLDEPLQTDKPKALEKQKKKIKSDLLIKWIPVVILIFIVVYSMTPLAIKTMLNSTISLFNFDFIRTSFILIWYFNIAFLLISLKIIVRLIIKIRE